MKKNHNTSIFFTLFILFSLTFTLNGCDNSGDKDIDNSCETFLECQNGTVWTMDQKDHLDGTGWTERDGIDHLDYYTFHNNLTKPWMVYEDNNDPTDCYYIDVYYEGDNDESLIIENSKNVFIHQLNIYDSYGTNSETLYATIIYTFTYSNDQLTLKFEFFDKDLLLTDTENYTFTKSTFDVSSLTMCD